MGINAEMLSKAIFNQISINRV